MELRTVLAIVCDDRICSGSAGPEPMQKSRARLISHRVWQATLVDEALSPSLDEIDALAQIVVPVPSSRV